MTTESRTKSKRKMRNRIIQRSKRSFALALHLGYQTDQQTGKRKRIQKWVTVHGTRKQAEKELTRLLGKVDNREFVMPTKLTFGEWLDSWLAKSVKPPMRRPRTYAVYCSVINGAVKTALGAIRLQELSAADIER